jgi:hypothetical protein
MTSVQMIESEMARLNSLSRLEILDTPREKIFDRIVPSSSSISSSDRSNFNDR